MKNYLKYLCVWVFVALLGTGVYAQKLRPVQMKVKPDLSKEVELQRKKAQDEWRQKLKNKVWFANRSLRQRCEEVPGCDSWAKGEFMKDMSFHISHTQVEHGGAVQQDNGKWVMSKVTVSFLYTNSKHSKGRFRSFSFKNVPFGSKKCFDCSNYRSNYMGGFAGSYR